MSDERFPFGFSGSGSGPGGPGDGDDVSAKTPLFAELDKLMSWSGGPVNWDLARQVAIRAAAEGDRRVSSAETHEVGEALRLADLWLENTTDLPSGLRGEPEAWNQVRWVEATLPVWRSLIDPVAEQVVGALGSGLTGGLQQLAEGGMPPELAASLPPGMADALPSDPAALAAMMGPVMGMLRPIGGMLFGSQAGQALGALAQEVFASGEIGLPLAPSGMTALLPAHLQTLAGELGIPVDQVRLFLAVREAALARLFGHVPWLRAGLLGAVEEYARGITVDPAQLQQGLGAMGGMFGGGLGGEGGFGQPIDPAAMEQALGENLFDAEPSPEQKRALNRLETLLALVEGWVDAVTDAAVSGRLPAAAPLREAVRRRRAEGGPAEATFAALVGLQLRPRRLQEAAAVWIGLATARGIAGRDALWGHPDLLPGPDDLDDPAAFVVGHDDVVGNDPVGEIEALLAADRAASEAQAGPGSPEATADTADTDTPATPDTPDTPDDDPGSAAPGTGPAPI